MVLLDKTFTSNHNTTAIAPQPHYDNTECSSCHPHRGGFPTYTTVFRGVVGRLLAFIGLSNAYAEEPPPLENYSMGGDGLLSFEAEATVQTEGSQASGQTVTSDVTYYYHNDHLGTPLFLSDESGAAVWRREQEPFGATTFERGTASEQLRFPGQYYDAETGLAQNWHRDYSAILGRYLEADPIGQWGGVNEYIYGYASPLENIDKTGLMVFKCCRNTRINYVVDTANKMLGFKHCFIRTNTKVAGMGAKGTDKLPLNPYHWPTEIKNHSMEVSISHCIPYRDVDEDCVNRELEIGKSTGLWEFGNNCNTFVDNILRKCKKKSRCDVFSNYTPPYDGVF